MSIEGMNIISRGLQRAEKTTLIPERVVHRAGEILDIRLRTTRVWTETQTFTNWDKLQTI